MGRAGQRHGQRSNKWNMGDRAGHPSSPEKQMPSKAGWPAAHLGANCDFRALGVEQQGKALSRAAFAPLGSSQPGVSPLAEAGQGPPAPERPALLRAGRTPPSPDPACARLAWLVLAQRLTPSLVKSPLDQPIGRWTSCRLKSI